VALQVGEPGLGFGGCWAGQFVVAVAGDQVAELLAAGDGVFGLDFGAESMPAVKSTHPPRGASKING
jgi:hypothetical protein